MLLFFSPSFYSKSYSFSSLFSFVCVIFKGIRRKDSISTRCTDFACMGGCFEYFIVWFIFAKDSKKTNWFSFSCSTFTAQLYIQIQIQYNVPINLTAVAQITVILLMSAMKEIALHLEECRY